MCGFSTPQAILWHQLSILQLKAILILSPWDSLRPHKLRAQTHKIAPSDSDSNHKSQVITCTFDWPATNWVSHNPLPWVRTFAKQLTEWGKHFPLPVYCIIKNMKRNIDGSQYRNFCPWGVGVCHIPDAWRRLPQLRSSLSLYLWDFNDGFITYAWLIIISISRPSAPSGE